MSYKTKKEVIKIRIKKEIKLFLVLTLLLIVFAALTLAVNEFVIDASTGAIGYGTSDMTTNTAGAGGSAALTKMKIKSLADKHVRFEIQGVRGAWVQFLSSNGIPTADIGADTNGTMGIVTRLVNQNITFYTNDGSVGERMRITNIGNVGIGTNSPVTLLHVDGKGSFGSSVSTARATRALNLIGSAGVMRVWRYINDGASAPAVELIYGTQTNPQDSGNFWWDFYVNPDAGLATPGSFVIRDRSYGAGNANRFVIDPSGNVGIGTTSPASDASWAVPGLDISGTRGTAILRTTSASGIATLRMTGPGASSVDDWHINMKAGAASTLTFNALAGGGVGANILVLKNDGNVGIGTTNPSHKLNVVGSANITSTIFTTSLTANTGDLTLKSTTGDVIVMIG